MATIIERFFKKISKNPANDCWEWTGARLPQGYGQFPVRELNQRRAHRVSWILHKGPIPEKTNVCHKCDNPPCVNPDHLFLGSQLANIQDCKNKGRFKAGKRNSDKTHCVHGHELTKENTRIDSRGMRQCNICRVSYYKAEYLRNKDRFRIMYEKRKAKNAKTK